MSRAGRGAFLFVPTGPVLNPALFFSTTRHPMPFPLAEPRCHDFYVARYGIYRLFQAIGCGPADTVLVPAYHQGNEVLAIRATGARVAFYSIGRDLQPDLDEVRALARRGARALLAIHYAGWPQPIRELATIRREFGLHLVEDCALAFLSESGGRPLGSYGDDAAFCLYKTLPIPNGAVVVRNRADLAGLPEPPTRSCGALSAVGRSLELSFAWWRNRFEPGGAALFGLKRMVGRALSGMALARHPVGDEGFDAARASLRMSDVSRRLLPRFDYAAIRARRRQNLSLLQERLGGEPGAFGVLPEGACPLFYPLLVRDKAGVVRQLRARGIEAIPFWNNGDPEAHSFPDARFLREHLVDLPIHQDVTPERIDHMAAAIQSLGRSAGSPRLPWSLSNASTTRQASIA